MFTEEPQLARWEDSQQCWRTDGFEEVNFDDINGTISFKSQFIGPICTFQVSQIRSSHLFILKVLLPEKNRLEFHRSCFFLPLSLRRLVMIQLIVRFQSLLIKHFGAKLFINSEIFTWSCSVDLKRALSLNAHQPSPSRSNY